MFRGKIGSCELNEAKLDWFFYEQSCIVKEKHFEMQKLALSFFFDEKGLYRSNTRVNPGKLKYFQEYPILFVAILILHDYLFYNVMKAFIIAV